MYMQIFITLIVIYFISLYIAYKGASKDNDDWYPIQFFNIKKGDVIRVINVKDVSDSNYQSAIIGVVIKVDFIDYNDRYIIIEIKHDSNAVKLIKLNLYSGVYQKLSN